VLPGEAVRLALGERARLLLRSLDGRRVVVFHTRSIASRRCSGEAPGMRFFILHSARALARTPFLTVPAALGDSYARGLACEDAGEDAGAPSGSTCVEWPPAAHGARSASPGSMPARTPALPVARVREPYLLMQASRIGRGFLCEDAGGTPALPQTPECHAESVIRSPAWR